MKRVSKLLGVIFAVSMLSGCASTRITSQADVTAKVASLDTVMVIADFADLDLRKLCEGEMKSHLSNHGVTSIGSTELFFPGSTYAPEEMQAKLADHHIQAILVISAYDAGTTQS